MGKRIASSNAEQIIAENHTVDENGCWIWKRQPSRRYPRITVDGQLFAVHRLSYTIHHGPIPDGLHICHRCDVTRCVNPDHLFAGTHHENMLDMAAKGRANMRGAVRFPDELIAEIRAKHRRGFPVSWIAADYGVSARHVHSIVTGRVRNG